MVSIGALPSVLLRPCTTVLPRRPQPVEKLLRALYCPRFRGRIRCFRRVLALFSGSLGPPTGPTTTFSTGCPISGNSATENPPPPGAPYAPLSLYCIGRGLCPLRLLLDRLGGFRRLSEGGQFSAEVDALPFGLFSPVPFLGQLL